MNKILLLLFFIPNLYASDLEFISINFFKTKIEFSALTVKDKKIFVVGDKIQDHFIYELELNGKNSQIKPFIDLTSLSGFYSILTRSIFSNKGGRYLKSPLDLEGISSCKDTWYLANEQTREVFKISQNSITSLDFNFKKIFESNKFPLDSLSINAGFEGISVDCDSKVIYLVQERSPRAILVLDERRLKIVDFILTELPSKDASLNDFSDIFYENEHLYLLERNHYRVSKYSLKQKKIVSSYSFKNLQDFDSSKLYDTNKPFGIAEGLFMADGKIYISFDNNKIELSKLASTKFELHGHYSVVIEFKRPDGF